MRTTHGSAPPPLTDTGNGSCSTTHLGSAPPQLTGTGNGSCSSDEGMQAWLLHKTRAAAAPIAAFLEGTVVYALSQQWDDLLAVYIFHLHQVPFCGAAADHNLLQCTAEASAAIQFRYVAMLVAVATTTQAYLEYGPLPYRWHGWRTIGMRIGPRIFGMCIGWGLGGACKAALLVQPQWRGTDLISCTTPICNLSNVAAAGALTLATAVAMLLTQPALALCVPLCGATHVLMLAAGCLLRTLVVLVINGLAVSVKILWSTAFKSFLTWGVSAEQQGSVLYERALMLWAVALAAVFAAVTVELRRVRGWLEHAGRPHVHLPSGAPPREEARRGRCAVLDVRALGAQLLDLLEASCGWVVGCAFTDALVAYTPLADNTLDGGPMLALQQAGIACAFTLIALGWLVVSGQPLGGAAVPHASGASEEQLRRSHVEAAFTTNAFIFFVGWCWVIVLRDVTALVWLGMRALGLTGRAAFFAEASSVALLGPALTVGVLSLQALGVFERLERRLSGIPSKGDMSPSAVKAKPLFLL